MKKIIVLVISLALILSLTACDSSANEISMSQSNDTTITTTATTATSTPTTTTQSCSHSFSSPTCTQGSVCTKCGLFNSDALGHSWTEATCTTPKTCNKCDTTEGSKIGHDWGNPTCTTPRSCIVCFEVDPNSKPIGHSFVQGICEICGDDDPDYAQPTITTNKSNLELKNTSDIVYITVSGDYTIEYDIGDTNIVDCEWGDWDGYTVPLTFYPVSSGKTSVTISVEGYNESITIYVAVNMSTPADLTTLTIEGAGKEFKQYNTGLPNTIKLHSTAHRINNYPNNTVAIWVDFVVSCTDCVDYTGYIQLRYNLYNSSGVVVKTGTTITEFTHTYTQYADTLVFSDLPADDYKLVFSDKY